MRIGVIGAGNIGGTLGRLFAGAGHDVLVASRHPERITGLRAGTPEEAATFGEVVLLAPPGTAVDDVADDLHEHLDGKVVIDATNPYGVDRDTTEGEHLQAALPGARVVRGFNTLPYATLQERAGGSGADRTAVFLSGDDPEARATVGGLVTDLGFAPVELGAMSEVWRQEPDGPLYGNPLTEEQARQALLDG